MRGLIWCGLVWVFAVCGVGFGDEVVFKNGDRLSGSIKRVFDGKLLLESEVAGEVTIEMEKVATFSSAEAIEVHLSDGTVLKEKVSAAAEGQLAVAGRKIAVASVSAINPPVEPAVKWTGDAAVGLASSRGNTVTDNQSATVNLMRRSEKTRTTLGFDYAKAKQEDPDTGEKETTEDWWRLKGKYDYFFTKKRYGFLNGLYETDSIAELDKRVIGGGGYGYQWIESEKMNFSTEAGLAARYEKYENGTPSSTEMSAQVGHHFDFKINSKLKFINGLTYYPSMEDFSDYFLTSSAELRAAITENMFTNFKVLFDYDSTPARSAGSTDVKYIFGAGVSF